MPTNGSAPKSQCVAELSVRAFETERCFTTRESADAVYASELQVPQWGLDDVLGGEQRQVELAQARGSELRAQTQLNESVVELQRVSGTILSANGVNVQTLGSQAAALGTGTP